MDHPKLVELAEMEGYDDVLAMLEAATTDSIVPGICMTDGCDYTVDVEPDAREAFCEECMMNTVQSCLVIAEII